MKLLLTAIGKRVQLIKYLKRSCLVIGTDSSVLNAAMNFTDKFYRVPGIDEAGYVDKLLDICVKEKIDFLIPLYEPEFELLCSHREDFEAAGTALMLSEKEVITVCSDKWLTFNFFVNNNIPSPISYLSNMIDEKISYPLIIKPRKGMGSKGVFKINNKVELNFFINYVENPIIQEFVEGTEYTIDVLCDLNTTPISIVPRERIEVRSGEVSKSRTVKDVNIIEAVKDLCLKLRGIGPLTIQCIINKNREIKFTEINPRFGGGVPLTFEAGVDYGRYFAQMKEGRPIEPVIGEFKEITMLRYDEAVFR